MLNKTRRWLGLWKELKIFAAAAMHPKTPLPAKLLLAAAMVYVISPIDALPDLMPLLGQFDDLIALIGAGMAFLRMTQSVRENIRSRPAVVVP
jgi:uncharacterized membrane protein YkvA (DUF1232 family)